MRRWLPFGRARLCSRARCSSWPARFSLFFRERDNVAVFDTHGENFLTFGPKIAPIDALIIVADDDLAAFLTLSPDKRREEVGISTSLIRER